MYGDEQCNQRYLNRYAYHQHERSAETLLHAYNYAYQNQEIHL